MVSAPILCKKALTSSSFGIDGAAPFRVTEIAAAALADLSETQNDEYAYEVTVGDKIFYSPYTEAQRATLQAFVA